jgi:hypothetical protein
VGSLNLQGTIYQSMVHTGYTWKAVVDTGIAQGYYVNQTLLSLNPAGLLINPETPA